LTTRTWIPCPKCGAAVEKFRNPVPTVDIIIEVENQIILIERKNEPYGWAIPGGFLDYGETVEQCAVREAMEETSLQVELLSLLGVYSDPDRDPRQHTVSTVFIARADGTPKAADDAIQAEFFDEGHLPSPIVFDHIKVLNDYFEWKKSVSSK